MKPAARAVITTTATRSRPSVCSGAATEPARSAAPNQPDVRDIRADDIAERQLTVSSNRTLHANDDLARRRSICDHGEAHENLWDTEGQSESGRASHEPLGTEVEEQPPANEPSIRSSTLRREEPKPPCRPTQGIIRTPSTFLLRRQSARPPPFLPEQAAADRERDQEWQRRNSRSARRASRPPAAAHR
jgi:hypothetical protein